INIDNRESYSGSGRKLGEWFLQDHHNDLLELLRAKAPMGIEKKLTDGKNAVQHSTLFKLPTEILDMVVAELRGDDALFNFAITCKAIFVIAERHLVKFYEELFPSWRDCRIICIGDSMGDEDELPAGILTESEREKQISCYSTLVETVKNDRFEQLKHFQSDTGSAALWKKRAWGPHGYTSMAPDATFWADIWMLGGLHQHAEQVSTTSQVDREVLCNVSKREYVRDLALYDPEIPQCVTLAHALITLICWSRSADYALAYNIQAVRDMKRGRWAGDRFRIETEDALADLKRQGEDWTDITEEVGVVLRHLVKNNRHDWGGESDED
ncbi:hypothetical protein C8Q73DRAFT_638999, partial [Cubamyces lactineus]